MSEEIKPVKLKIFPNWNFTQSISRCGACNAIVPDGVEYCPSCGVPIYGRVGVGSYIKCPHCGAYVPKWEHLERCTNCHEKLE